MTPLELTLLVLCLLLVIACVWLAWNWSRHQAAGAVARAELERAHAQAVQADGALSQAQSQLEALRASANALEARVAALSVERDQLRLRHEAELRNLQEREQELVARLDQRDAQLRESFKALAADALRANADQFVAVARQAVATEQAKSTAELQARATEVKTAVAPIAEALRRADERLATIEKDWSADRATLVQQLRTVQQAGENLRDTTAKLVRALREPHVRGRYGELQLKKVAELAGMVEYCDFSTQATTASTSDGADAGQRPDMVVHLPNGREVVVDAKTNIQAYIDAQEATTPEEASGQLDRFARHVADQAVSLGRKRYWAQVQASPEFVVMFLPHDAFLDAALARKPDLIEHAWRQGVILATPSTLIALLRAVHVAYQEQRLALEARELRAIGAELHKRAADAFEHAQKLGRCLNDAVERFNDFSASYERKLQPQLRRFEASGVKGSKDLPELSQLATRARAAVPAPSAAAAPGLPPSPPREVSPPGAPRPTEA